MAKPLNEYAPPLFEVVVADAAPLNTTVAPLPPADGVNVPEMLKVVGEPPPDAAPKPYADNGQLGQVDPLDQLAGSAVRFVCELLTLVQPLPSRK